MLLLCIIKRDAKLEGNKLCRVTSQPLPAPCLKQPWAWVTLSPSPRTEWIRFTDWAYVFADRDTSTENGAVTRIRTWVVANFANTFIQTWCETTRGKGLPAGCTASTTGNSEVQSISKFRALHFQIHPAVIQICQQVVLRVKVTSILLRSESPSVMCAKVHTMAASNNRVHMPQSLFAYASYHIQSFTC